MVEIDIDTTDLERVLQTLHRRAAFMVRDLIVLGRHAADDYALAGGRHHLHPGRYTYLRRQGRRPMRLADYYLPACRD